VAKQLLCVISEITGAQVSLDFESMAKWWLHGKKFSALNVTNAAVLWTIWKSRNDMCFHGVQWKKMEKIFGRCAGVIRN
jgi:hypothetical protein